MDELQIDGWARIFDTDTIGQVRKLGQTPVPWAKLITEQGQAFTLPQAILSPMDDPAIERAAFAILDILREFDPTWSQVDTSELRRRIVRTATSAVANYNPAINR